MLKRYGVLGIPVVIASIIFLVLHTISPQSVGPAGIFFVFALIYAFFLSMFTLTLYFGFKVLRRFTSFSLKMKPQKAYYIASVIACFPVFLLAIMSIDRLSVVDVLLVSFFVFLASFYVARRT